MKTAAWEQVTQPRLSQLSRVDIRPRGKTGRKTAEEDVAMSLPDHPKDWNLCRRASIVPLFSGAPGSNTVTRNRLLVALACSLIPEMFCCRWNRSRRFLEPDITRLFPGISKRVLQPKISDGRRSVATIADYSEKKGQSRMEIAAESARGRSTWRFIATAQLHKEQKDIEESCFRTVSLTGKNFIKELPSAGVLWKALWTAIEQLTEK